ncbi:unnamed protein product, partial [Meganyctiphanes norvegica]
GIPSNNTYLRNEFENVKLATEVKNRQVLTSAASTNCHSSVDPAECIHSKAMQYKANKHKSYSQQQVAYIQPYSQLYAQPYTQTSPIEVRKKSDYFTSDQEKSIYKHLKEVIKVCKSGYLDQATLKDIISKKVDEEGWKNLKGKICNSILNEFLNRHKNLGLIFITFTQENILYNHVIDAIENLKSNNIGLMQIDKKSLFKIVKQKIIMSLWENLYSITETWFDLFLERHSDLKMFINVKESQKDYCLMEHNKKVNGDIDEPVIVFEVTDPPSSKCHIFNGNYINLDKSNIKSLSNFNDIKDVAQSTKSWGRFFFSSVKEPKEPAETDVELSSLLLESCRISNTQSSKASNTFINIFRKSTMNKEKDACGVMDHGLSMSQIRNSPKSFVTPLLVSEGITDVMLPSTIDMQVQNTSKSAEKEKSNILSNTEIVAKSNNSSLSDSK